MDTKKRVLHYDILRILAIVLVIYNHTGKNGYYHYAECGFSFAYYLYVALAAITAIGVPIFFMISGALLLGREESYGTLFKKRILRILIVLFLFSFVQYLYACHIGVYDFQIKDFFRILITENVVVSYWFLYAYLAYLLVLPFLRKIAIHLHKQDFICLIVLQLLIGGIVPILFTFTGYSSLNSFFKLFILDNIIFYPLIGYYMEHVADASFFSKRNILLSLIASITSIAVITIMTRIRNLSPDDYTPWDNGLFESTLSFVIAICVYMQVRYVMQHISVNHTLSKIISTVGVCTFGVYLTEEIFRHELFFIFEFFSKYTNTFISCAIYVIAVFLCSTILTLILRMLPGFKKLL